MIKLDCSIFIARLFKEALLQINKKIPLSVPIEGFLFKLALVCNENYVWNSRNYIKK